MCALDLVIRPGVLPRVASRPELPNRHLDTINDDIVARSLKDVVFCAIANDRPFSLCRSIWPCLSRGKVDDGVLGQGVCCPTVKIEVPPSPAGIVEALVFDNAAVGRCEPSFYLLRANCTGSILLTGL